MKTSTLSPTILLLLIASIQAHASSIELDLPRANSAASDIYDTSRPVDAANLLQKTSEFHMELPGALTGAHFCAVSQPSTCGIASLMVRLGAVGNAEAVGATASTSDVVTASGASASRVPLPGALGLFGMALLIFGVIRRKQSA